MTPVFVYGLLKPGFRLHYVVAPYVVRSEPATVRGCLYDAGYPAARFDEEGTIEGWLLWLDPVRAPQALALLDDVEDEGRLYRRVRVTATTRSGRRVAAEAYEYLPPLTGGRPVGWVWLAP